MLRIHWPDGEISDMIILGRAKDATRSFVAVVLRFTIGPRLNRRPAQRACNAAHAFSGPGRQSLTNEPAGAIPPPQCPREGAPMR
jgi:hypothetical protein